MPAVQRNLTDPSSTSSFTFLDDWALAVAYEVNDVVPHPDGTTYVCVGAHTSAADNEPGVGAFATDFWRVWSRGVIPGATLEAPALLGYSEIPHDFGAEVLAGVYDADLSYSYHYWTTQDEDLNIRLAPPVDPTRARSVFFEVTQDGTGGHNIFLVDENDQPVPRFSEGDSVNLFSVITNTIVATWSPARLSWAYRVTGDVDWRRPLAYFESFDALTVGVKPVDWSERWNIADSDWTVQDDATAGGRSLQHVTSIFDNRALSWDTVTQSYDAEIFTVLRSTSASTATLENLQAQVIIQGSGAPGAENGYYVSVETSGQVALARWRDGVSGHLVALPNHLVFAANARYAVRLRTELVDEGLLVRCKVWQPADPLNPTADEPAAWQASYTDTEPRPLGWLGLGGWSVPGARLFERVGAASLGGTAPVN